MNTKHKKDMVAGLLALTIGTAAALTSFTASASDRRVATERFTEYGEVIDVRPVYTGVRGREPRQECWIETTQKIVGYEQPRYERYEARRSESHRSATGAVVGGLIGGVIGNQLGRGRSSNSRAGATIAGAIIGGAVGNESRGNNHRQRRHQRVLQQGAPIYQTVEVERCKRVSKASQTQRLQHYDVTYRYKGRTFTTRTKRDPGRRIELQVSVAPARQ